MSQTNRSIRMSLSDLPDVALIKIFHTLDHLELVKLYHNFSSSTRLQNLIQHSSRLWSHLHIQPSVDYRLFTHFARLLISNASTTRQLIIDELDAVCRKILLENGFSLRKFSQLEELVIHDEEIGNILPSLRFCSSTLKSLRLSNDHINYSHANDTTQLTSLQLTLHSMNVLQNRFERVTNLHLKIMFDHDHRSQDVFTRLPNQSLETFTLKFLLLNTDLNFAHHFSHYLHSCDHLHTLELSYLHGMCPLPLHRTIDYSRCRRMVLINICHLNQMEEFIKSNRYVLPQEYLQLNATSNSNRYESYMHSTCWHVRQLIALDYIYCVTTSMELLNEYQVIWSDKNGKSQSFESYILRSIYNASHWTSALRNLVVSKFELSVNGLVTLMTSFPLLMDLSISDGKIDQMGSGMWDLKRILGMPKSTSQSAIQTIVMNHIHMSRRTVLQFCFITQQLRSLGVNDVKILDKSITPQENSSDLRPSFLLLLKEVAQQTNQFRWPHLKSLTLGKNMINRQNLSSFVPSHLHQLYSVNLHYLRLIVHDQTLFEPFDAFLKAMKRLVRMSPNLTSLIIEFTRKYNEHFLLRNHLHALFESHVNKRVAVYAATDDLAFRFCFEKHSGDDDDDDESSSSQAKRTFCGIPLFQSNKQRKSNVFS